MDAASPHHGRTLGGLFSDLWRETTTLVRDETQLAKVEISQTVSKVETAAVSLAAGGLVMFAGLIVLLLAAANALAMVLPPEHAAWLSPLIVGLVVIAIGAVLLSKARANLKANSLKPTRTLQSLRRDRELAREHVR